MPNIILIHYTAGASMASAVNWFLDPSSQCSAHVVIDRDGHMTQCVDLDRIAWHAGDSSWGGQTDLNKCAWGIELVNRGWGVQPNSRDAVLAKHKHERVMRFWQDYPGAQINAVVELCRLLCTVSHVLHILGHDDVAPGRKLDPGPLFPWDEVRSRVAVVA